MCCSIKRLIASDLALHARNLFLRARDPRLRAFYLSVKLRHFQHCQCLSLANTISDIDIDMSDISGDLSMDIDLLKRLKNTTQHKLPRDLSTANCYDGDIASWLCLGAFPGR